MADNTTLNSGTGGNVIRTDDISGVHFPVSKIALGADGTDGGFVSSANPLPISDASGSLTVDNGGTFAVQESGAALTALQLIDDPVKTDDAAFTPGTDKVLMVGAECDNTSPDSVDEGDAGALRMSANRNLFVQVRDAAGNERGLNVDASGNIGVTDASGSLTVDGTVAVSSLPAGSVAATTAKTADYDSGAGTDTVPMMGLALPASGGAVAGGTSTNPVRTDPTGTTAQPVTDNGSTLSVDDGGGSLTVDGSVSLGSALPAGTNNIGDVDVLTQPARARTTDTMSAALATDAVMNGTTALTPRFAKIAAASSGDNTLVSAVVSKKIRVLSLMLLARGDVDAYFKSSGGTTLFGDGTTGLDLTTNSGFALNANPFGWFETASGEGLVLNLGGAVGVAGGLTYVEV